MTFQTKMRLYLNNAFLSAVLLLPVIFVLASQSPGYTQEKTDSSENLNPTKNVSMEYVDADIQDVLRSISKISGINIVNTPDVVARVDIKLDNVPWEKALDIILKSYGFGYEKQDNVILVTKMENISKIQADEPLKTEIITLKFLDAQDAQRILIPMLSPRGKISVLYSRGQRGWKFGSFKIGKESAASQELQREAEQSGGKSETISIERNDKGDIISKKAEFESSVKSKTLIITDTAASLDKIRNVILPFVDKKPKQVIIEARLMEVNKDKLKDLGVDWGLGGSSNAEGGTIETSGMTKNSTMGGRVLGSEQTPSLFGPKEGSAVFPGTEPYNLGAELLFKKLTGTKFEAVLHALEEDVRTNTLSSPRILTLDNQEASILVGYHTPILKSEISGGTSATDPTKLTQTLDYYQEIGIRLNVVPQVNEEGYINMIIHPSVTSSTSSVSAQSVVGTTTTTTTYPIIDVREAQTQVLIKDGETIVIGGLLKDVKGKQIIGVPFLSKIPYLGKLFRRETYDTQKVDLLMFITARMVKEGEFSPEEIERLEKALGEEKQIVVQDKIALKEDKPKTDKSKTPVTKNTPKVKKETVKAEKKQKTKVKIVDKKPDR